MQLLLADGTDLHGSSLTLGGELVTPGSIVVHEGCYTGFAEGRSNQGGAETGR